VISRIIRVCFRAHTFCEDKLMVIWRYLSCAAGLALVLLPAAAPAQRILDFAQLDASRDTRTLVLVRALRGDDPKNPAPPLLSLTYTDWDTGSTASAGYMHRWALTRGTHKWSVGAGAGANHFRSEGNGDDKTALSARAQTELSGPAPGGSYYGLLQVSSFRRGGLGLFQYDIANSPVGFEIRRYLESGHHHTAGIIRYALDQRRHWFLRAGIIRSNGDDQLLVGLAYNAF
jgi:hypothetical protein